jgi:hypothetical protein
MNDRIVSFFLFFTLPAFCNGQDIIFHPGEDQVQQVKLSRGNLIRIETDTAYLYSWALEKKIQELKQDYLHCLEDREQDLANLENLLLSLDSGYRKVDRLLEHSSGLNEKMIVDINRQVMRVMENMKKDIQTLEELKEEIARASQKLENIREDIKKERRKKWIKNAGLVVFSTAAGLVIGLLLGSA